MPYLTKYLKNEELIACYGQVFFLVPPPGVFFVKRFFS